MELKLKNGDYVPDGAGGLAAGTGAEEILSRVLFRLTARRGGLPFLPELGSELYKVLREKPSARLAAARQYVSRALEGENVTVTDVRLEDMGRSARLTVSLLWQGEELSVSTMLKGG